MREKFIRFMQGRYGLDSLGKFLIYGALIVMLIGSFIRLGIITFIAIGMIVWGYYRIFSRNTYKRSMENQKYLTIKNKVTGFFKRLFKSNNSNNYRSNYNSYSGNVYEQQYKIFKCPQCKQKLRVPRGKGKIQIHCRRCGHEFIKRS